jgi:hypothetical protein
MSVIVWSSKQIQYNSMGNLGKRVETMDIDEDKEDELDPFGSEAIPIPAHEYMEKLCLAHPMHKIC